MVIPKRIRSFVRLLDAQEMLYGVRIDSDSRSVVLDSDEPVSTRVRYDTIDFTDVAPLLVDTVATVTARKNRVADAVLIEGEADLTEQITTVTTKFLYNPEVIFLKEEARIETGRAYRIRIRYPYGADSLDAIFEVEPA